MDTAMNQQELEKMFDKAVREVTEQTAGIHLCQCTDAPDGELCTVHIKWERGFHTSVTLCADTEMLKRMTRQVVQTDQVTPQDLEDFTKEYFNLLCGRIAAALFKETKVASRFGLPDFHSGRYAPEGHAPQFELNYTSDRREGAQIIHHVPYPDTREAAQSETTKQADTAL